MWIYNYLCFLITFYLNRLGEFMEVRVVHAFVIQKKEKYECNFILADQTNYISAIAFCDVGSDLPEIYKKLKV